MNQRDKLQRLIDSDELRRAFGLGQQFAGELQVAIQRRLDELRGPALDPERLACAIALVGPVDMDDTDDAARSYAANLAHEYETLTEIDLAHFAGDHDRGAALAEAARDAAT